ncbi:helix-turn-helix domain-containing protein [Novosphingobium olei]|uniref:Helix-turn-helix domain-containing protein n=1 Tax=Novosphingobium olei TaxID=2728851 RepID=A0A7Y0G9Z5_9SPHN|nr:helix-turn-helix domain-containing protein [Novosphingobium olei]NML94731.1 helix-turn-helix domain-containing protein [Novosphingobium olei]
MTIAGNPEPLTYSIADVVRATSLSRARIYQLLSADKLRSVKIGRRTLVDAQSLRDLLQRGCD